LLIWNKESSTRRFLEETWRIYLIRDKLSQIRLVVELVIIGRKDIWSMDLNTRNLLKRPFADKSKNATVSKASSSFIHSVVALGLVLEPTSYKTLLMTIPASSSSQHVCFLQTTMMLLLHPITLCVHLMFWLIMLIA
jgi:hypothetical protein